MNDIDFSTLPLTPPVGQSVVKKKIDFNTLTPPVVAPIGSGQIDFSTLQKQPEPIPVDPLKPEKDKFNTWYDTLEKLQPDIGSERPEDIYRMYVKSSPTPLPQEVFNLKLQEKLNLAQKANNMLTPVADLAVDFLPWIGAAKLIPKIGIAKAGGVYGLIEGAKKLIKDAQYGANEPAKEGLDRIAGGMGSWIDPRAEKDMPEHAIIAREVLDAMTYFLTLEKGGVAGKVYKGAKEAYKGVSVPALSGAKALGSAARNNFPLINAGLIEAQTWAKKPVQLYTRYVTDNLWKGYQAAMDAKIMPTTEKMFAHGALQKYADKPGGKFVWKSINEIIEPAVDRMNRKGKGAISDIFRQNEVIKGNIVNWSENVKNLLASEPDPFVRNEIMKGMRGTPVSELTTEKAKAVVAEYMPKLSEMGLPKMYENKLREAIGKFIGERLEAPENIFIGDSFKNVLDPVVKKVANAKVSKLLNLVQRVIPERVGIGPYKLPIRPSNTTFKTKAQVKELQAGLRDIIEDPLISPEIQTAAKDIYNIPAMLPAEVFKAADTITHSLLTRQLREVPGLVLHDRPERVLKELYGMLREPGISPQAQSKILSKIKTISKSQYMPSTWKPFIKNGKNSLWVERDTELELKAMDLIPQLANKTWNKYFMGPWKISKAMMRPAAILRNGLTNEILNHMGGLPMWRQDIYKKGLAGMRGSEQKFLGQSLNKHFKDYTNLMGTPLSYAMSDLANVGALKYEHTLAEGLLSKFDKFANPAKSLYSALEQHAKFSKYLHNLEKGMGEKEAAIDAMKWTFNYGEVTRATAKMRTYAVPFFTWQSKVFPLFAESIIKNPIKWTGAIMLYRGMQNAALEEAGMTRSEWDDFKTQLPDYLNNGMIFPMPWRDEQGRLNMMDLTYIIPGFGDAYQMSGHPFSQFFQHPVVSIIGGLQNNRKFSGAPIYHDWEDGTTIAAKCFAHIWEQLIPAPLPGGTDFNHMYQAFVETPNSEFEPLVSDLSRTQAVSSFLGGKIIPVDESTTISNAANLKSARISEINTSLRSLLRKARTEEERNALIEKYSNLTRGVYQPEAED